MLAIQTLSEARLTWELARAGVFIVNTLDLYLREPFLRLDSVDR